MPNQTAKEIPISVAQGSMEIEILRTQDLPQCTVGTMGVNNSSLAASLELPWKDNQTNISRIPAGELSNHPALRPY